MLRYVIGFGFLALLLWTFDLKPLIVLVAFLLLLRLIDLWNQRVEGKKTITFKVPTTKPPG